jgi:hypothetical protein
MSTEQRDGGPVFPVFTNQYHYAFEKEMPATVAPGMTLRDYIAAKAMAAHITRFPMNAVKDGDETDFDQMLAQWAYQMADAMLEAREA